MYGLQFKNELPEPVVRELEQFISWLDGYLHQEHDEDGRHFFPEFTEGKNSFEDTVVQIIDRYQARGQFWKYGAWLFNDASDFRAGRAWLRVPDPAAATYNNYSPVGVDRAVVLEIEPQGDITITGLKAREGKNENRLLIIRNRDSSATITLTHEGTGSLAPYRFDLPGDVDIDLGPRQTAWFLYDTGRERWGAIITGHDSGGISVGGAAYTDAQVEIAFRSGDGAALLTGAQNIWSRIPFNATITGWQVVADRVGSIEFDLWVDDFASFPPTSADSIIGAGTAPALSSARTATFANLTSWTTALTKGERFEVEIVSVTDIREAVLSLYLTRSS